MPHTTCFGRHRLASRVSGERLEEEEEERERFGWCRGGWVQGSRFRVSGLGSPERIAGFQLAGFGGRGWVSGVITHLPREEDSEVDTGLIKDLRREREQP